MPLLHSKMHLMEHRGSMLFVPTVKYHFNYHWCTDTRHPLPYKRYTAANNACDWVNTYHVTAIELIDLNTLVRNKTTHFIVVYRRILERLSNFSKGMQLVNSELSSNTRLSDAQTHACHNRVFVHSELIGFLGRSITYTWTDVRTNELHYMSLSLGTKKARDKRTFG